MPEAIIEHYRAYAARPFSAAERSDVTLLFGGLHWRAERLLQGMLENLGYNVRVLPTATRQDLLTGRELADIGQCCPTSFTTGNLANFLRAETERIGGDAVVNKYVHLTAGSCGACRFGQYHQSYELALRGLGLEAFRLFLLAQNSLNQGAVVGGGLELNLPFTLGAVWSVMMADLIQDLEYQIRPYEVTSGETSRIARESIEELYETFRKLPAASGNVTAVLRYLGSRSFTRVLEAIKDRFAQIEVDRSRIKPVVKITGEFYLQTVEGAPNYDIHRWLEAEGAEVYPAAITVWLDYLLRLEAQELAAHIRVDKRAAPRCAVVRTLAWTLRASYERLRAGLGNLPRPLPQQAVLRGLAEPYFDQRMKGGEGDMLIGKALWAHRNRKAHMICELSPYACLPNTMSIGAMARVTADYPDLLYAPLEIKGDAEVHALSRCQMILSEARRVAQAEYAETLAALGLTNAEARALIERSRHARRADYKLDQPKVTGTASKLVRQLAAERAA